MPCCLLDLFSLLKYFNVPNLEGLKTANTHEHTHNGKSTFHLALIQVPWLQLDPTGCPSRPYQPLPTTPNSPCFDVRKRFFGGLFQLFFFRAVMLAIISILADVPLLSLCSGLTSLPLSEILLPSGIKPQEQSLSLLKPFFLLFLL